MRDGTNGVGSKGIEPIALTVNKAAETIGLSRATIYNLIARGDLRDIKVAGRRLILMEDLRGLIAPHSIRD